MNPQPGLLLIVSVLVASRLPTQVVVPASLAAVKGIDPVFSPFDFHEKYRYQAIVTQLTGSVGVFVQLSFRQGADRGTCKSHVSTASLTVGEARYAARTNVFASNFVQQPFVAMAARPLNLPDYRLPPSGCYPGPFNVALPFDRAWVYSGVNDLCFDIQVAHSDPSVGNYALDSYYMQVLVEGAMLSYGSG